MSKRLLLFSLIFLLFVGATASAAATTIVFNDFSDTSILDLNGSATTTTTGGVTGLRLTPASGNQIGSAFILATINAATFSTYFE